MKILLKRSLNTEQMHSNHDTLSYLYHVIQDISNTSEKTIIIGIDGMSASGKTTMAEKLSSMLDCNVYHMDDFFLQPHQRTEERNAEIGGNVDYERFYEEIIVPLKENRNIIYRPYNCKEGKIVSSHILTNKNIHIIEGAYSHHPNWMDIYDIKIFIGLSAQLQMDRITKRNGLEMLEMFKSQWIPKENAYFHAYEIEPHSDISLWVEE